MFRIISPKLLELFHTRTISQLWISAVSGSFQRKLSAAIFSGRFSGGLTMPCDVNRKHRIYRVYISVTVALHCANGDSLFQYELTTFDITNRLQKLSQLIAFALRAVRHNIAIYMKQYNNGSNLQAAI